MGSIDLRFQSNYNGKTRFRKVQFRKVQGTFVSDDNDKRTRGQVYPFRPGRNGSGPPEELPRRLAAILAADIAGYSRLMGHDEEGTHGRIKRQRSNNRHHPRYPGPFVDHSSRIAVATIATFQ